MAMEWFRLYHDLFGDRRFRRLPVTDRWCWVAILKIASTAKPRGFLLIGDEPMTAQDLADEAAVSLKVARRALKWFQEGEYILSKDGVLFVDGWDRRQFESDSSTERSRRHRERQRVYPTSSQRPRNVASDGDATDQSTETEIEENPPTPLVDVGKVAAEVESLLGRTLGSSEADTVMGWARRFPASTIRAGIDKGVASGKTSIPYVGSIIARLHEEGYKPPVDDKSGDERVWGVK